MGSEAQPAPDPSCSRSQGAQPILLTLRCCQGAKSDRAGSGCSWQGDGKCCWRGTTGRENRRHQLGALLAPRAASRAPSCAGLAGTARCFSTEHHPGVLELPLHIQSEVGKESSTYLVCAGLSLLPGQRTVPAPEPPEPPGAGSRFGSRELRDGTLRGDPALPQLPAINRRLLQWRHL